MKTAGGGYKFGFEVGCRSGTPALWRTNLAKGNLLFRITPGKVNVKKNAGDAVLTVWRQAQENRPYAANTESRLNIFNFLFLLSPDTEKMPM